MPAEDGKGAGSTMAPTGSPLTLTSQVVAAVLATALVVVFTQVIAPAVHKTSNPLKGAMLQPRWDSRTSSPIVD